MLAAICLIVARSTGGQTEKTPVDKFLGATYNPESFAAELQLTEEALRGQPRAKQSAELRDSLPQYWNVVTPEQTYEISSAYLKELLGEGKASEADVWVKHMVAEVESCSAREWKGNANARAEIDKILAGHEFATAHQPSAWGLFRQRLSAWFDRLLYKLFGEIDRYPMGQRVLFWAVVFAAVVFIALWLFRFMASRDSFDSMPPGEIVSALRTWQEWVGMAREAASRRDFREAVHSAYWAGIARLEDTGVVPRDRTKTPREYLQLVVQTPPSELGQRAPNYGTPLGELTKRLERIWYANRGAGPEDFAETLKQLQEMGCQLE